MAKNKILKTTNPWNNSKLELGILEFFKEFSISTKMDQLYHSILFGKRLPNILQTQRDRIIINTTIKWLATSEGSAFLREWEGTKKRIINEQRKYLNQL